MWLLAADSPVGETTVPFAGLVSYGALGLIVVLAILGYVTFKPDITRLERQMEKDRETAAGLLKTATENHERAIADVRKHYSEEIAALRKDHTEQISAMRRERDKADEQRDAMAETFQKEWIPALVKFLTTTEALLPLLQRMVDRTGGDHNK